MTGKLLIFQADLLLGPCSLIDKCLFLQAVLLFGAVLLLETGEYPNFTISCYSYHSHAIQSIDGHNQLFIQKKSTLQYRICNQVHL